jgi:hypothetical protein
MDIFKDLKNKNNNYSDKIDVNKYTQSNRIVIKETEIINNNNNNIINTSIDHKILNNVINESIEHAVDNGCVKYTKQELSKKQFRSIYELILSIKDHNYTILEDNEKEKYVSDKKMLLCSEIDDEYSNYNFNKKISKSLICSNLQKKTDNILSLILFYNEYFKINIVFYNKSNNKFYKTGLKNYDYIYISYHNRKWIILDDMDGEHNYSDINELHTVLNIDLKNNSIYNLYLKAISNYKSDELINIAKELNIDLLINGKKKVKKVLYDEINSLKL